MDGRHTDVFLRGTCATVNYKLDERSLSFCMPTSRKGSCQKFYHWWAGVYFWLWQCKRYRKRL